MQAHLATEANKSQCIPILGALLVLQERVLMCREGGRCGKAEAACLAHAELWGGGWGGGSDHDISPGRREATHAGVHQSLPQLLPRSLPSKFTALCLKVISSCILATVQTDQPFSWVSSLFMLYTNPSSPGPLDHDLIAHQERPWFRHLGESLMQGCD